MASGDTTLRIQHADSGTTNANYFVGFYINTTLVGGIDSQVVYDTFTAGHPTEIEDMSGILQGMILKSTGEVFHRQDISNAWVKTEITTTVKDKAVVGVFNKEWGTENRYLYNAIGEGQILVTDSGGNIETGDYICSSDRLGHGMLQDDDILHNYTVAKATESVDWSTIAINESLGYKSKLIACTYHCG